MKTGRRKFDSAFKVKVALEALKGARNFTTISPKIELHPHQISHGTKSL